MRRRIFIGDIQGCSGELDALLEELRFDPDADRLLPAGDLVNRGPDSLGTLRRLRELGAQPVLGNHDLALLRTWHGLRATGSTDTFGDVLAAPDRDELLGWLGAQPFVRAFGDLFLVHAGLHPEWRDPVAELAGADPLAPDPRTDFVTRVRLCNRRGEMAAGDEPREGFDAWYRFYRPEWHGGRGVVFAHWAARGRVEEGLVRGLDTGCVWGGSLTAWVPEEDRWASVPAARAYAAVGGEGA